MAIRLRRLWVNLDDDQNLILLNRPRVSFEIDQYVWNIIEQGIVIPNGIMQSEKHDYVLVVSLSKYNSDTDLSFMPSPYNGILRDATLLSVNKTSDLLYKRADFVDGQTRKRWFSPSKFWTNQGNKTALVRACADIVTEHIAPLEYADLLFDAFGAFLLYNFKRVKKSELDELKIKIDKNVICGFTFPAPFSQQHYQGDNANFRLTSYENGQEKILIDIPDVEIFYKQHFTE